jgi:hypothetical protein
VGFHVEGLRRGGTSVTLLGVWGNFSVNLGFGFMGCSPVVNGGELPNISVRSEGVSYNVCEERACVP